MTWFQLTGRIVREVLKSLKRCRQEKEVSKMLLSQKFCVKKFTYMRMAPVTKESPPTKRLMNPPIRAQSPPRRPRYPAATGIQGEYRELIGSESSYGGGLSWLGTGVTTALSSIGTVLSIVWIVSNSHNVKKQVEPYGSIPVVKGLIVFKRNLISLTNFRP